ncbi:MAG: ribonuclease III [Pseudomonadota bacterium]|nr:ribonuclease III [Pseudomonadota bacterium]
MNRRAEAAAALEARLGHLFADRSLLERALTHASVGDGAGREPHNETLEFLGDRVLGLLAAESLVAFNPDWREGELTRRQVALVSGATCADVARGLDLGPALRLAGSMSQQGGRGNDRILGDALEALMAAVYLDGGLDAARAVFLSAWREALIAASGEQDVEAKTALQEWAMAKGLAVPTYCVVSRVGAAHAPMFTVSVKVEGYAPESASGPALRVAEKAAARKLLARERGAG